MAQHVGILPYGLTFTTAALLLILLYAIGLTFYRLFLHPLAKFPGPKLAALTTWYEGYYDVVKTKGRFTFELGRLHRKYGPIVRIGPNELHVLDPPYYQELYSMKNRLDKYDYFYRMLGNPEATFPTIHAEVHKGRRAALAPFFSTQAVSRFQPRVQKYTDKFCDQIRAAGQRGEPVPMFFALRCLTVDIISEYVFGHPLHMLDRADWGKDFYSAWRALWELSPLIRQFPWLMPVFDAMPRWLLAIVQPKALEVIDMKLATDRLTRDVLNTDEATVRKREQPTVLWELSHSEVLPAEDKTFERIAIDANNVLAAGFETTGATLTHLLYLVLANPGVKSRLLDELEQAIPDPNRVPGYLTLEKLPYLYAVVKETLRMAVGAYSRLPRVNRKEAMRYKDWIIPAGTAVGMSALYIEFDESIFGKDPHTFRPERWLEPGAHNRMEPYLTAFGKGTRMCLGQNLAYAELYSVTATVLRRFPNLELYQTGPEDVEAVADYFAGMWRYENGKAGLQVMVKN